MQVHVKVDEKEMNELEKLHYLVEAKVNLLARLQANGNTQFNDFMEDYVATFKEYSLYKENIDHKYRPEEYKNTAKSWRADFVSRELVYEVE